MFSKSWTLTGPRPSALLGSIMVIVFFAGCEDTGRSVSPTARQQQERTATRNVAGTLAEDFDPAVPLAYYQLSLDFSKRTAGFTPPVQSRAYAYMGLALYEALVSGMPSHRSIASQLNGIGPLPTARGVAYHWPLVANAAQTVRPLNVDFLGAHGNTGAQHIGHGALMVRQLAAVGAEHSIRSAKPLIGIAEFRRPAP